MTHDPGTGPPGARSASSPLSSVILSPRRPPLYCPHLCSLSPSHTHSHTGSHTHAQSQSREWRGAHLYGCWYQCNALDNKPYFVALTGSVGICSGKNLCYVICCYLMFFIHVCCLCAPFFFWLELTWFKATVSKSITVPICSQALKANDKAVSLLQCFATRCYLFMNASAGSLL